MLKHYLFKKEGYEFLEELDRHGKSYVVVNRVEVVNGVEDQRAIDIDLTQRLHEELQARGYNDVPSRFRGMQVVTLDEALSALFRQHPHTGKPISEEDDPFHPSQMSPEAFLAYLFGQEINVFAKGDLAEMLIDASVAILTNNKMPELTTRIEAARVASSIHNPDTEALKKAESRVWYNNPNNGDLDSTITAEDIDWFDMALGNVRSSPSGIFFSAGNLNQYKAKPEGQGIRISRGSYSGYAADQESFPQAVLQAWPTHYIDEMIGIEALKNLATAMMGFALSNYTNNDIRALAAQLQQDWDDIPGNTKSSKALNLVDMMRRHGRHDDLVLASMRLQLI